MSRAMDPKRATTILGVPGRLKELQEGSGLKSKAEFLRLVKIHKGQWARYLKHELPGPDVLARIARATGRSREWILSGNEELAEARPATEHVEPELQRAISLLRRLYNNRAHREHDWRVLMAVLDDDQARAGSAAKRARKR